MSEIIRFKTIADYDFADFTFMERIIIVYIGESNKDFIKNNVYIAKVVFNSSDMIICVEIDNGNTTKALVPTKCVWKRDYDTMIHLVRRSKIKNILS